MKLYTFNATPLMRKDQAEKDPTYTGKLATFNRINLDGYVTNVSKLLADHGIDGFTMYEVDGYWLGSAERSFKIEVATGYSATVMRGIAKELRDLYNQDSVMLTFPDNIVEFI